MLKLWNRSSTHLHPFSLKREGYLFIPLLKREGLQGGFAPAVNPRKVLKLNLCKRLFEIFNQICNSFNADGDTNHSRRYSVRFQFITRHVDVR